MLFRNNLTVRPHSSKLAFIHRCVDAIAIYLALELAVFLTDKSANIDVTQRLLIATWTIVIFLFISDSNSVYGSARIESLQNAILAKLKIWLSTSALLMVLAYITKTSTDYSRLAMVTWFILTGVTLVLARVVLRLSVNAAYSTGSSSQNLAIAGKTPLGMQVKEKIESAPWLGLNFIGFFDDRLARREENHGEKEYEDTESIGYFSDLVDAAREGKVDYVYITLPMKAEQRIVELVNQLSDTTAQVYMVPNFFVFDLLHGKLTSLDGIPVLSLFESPFYGIDGIVKRIEDIIVASIILTMIAIPMLLIACAVKLTSKGPAIFKQRRYGLNGKVVEIWKFRSMTVTENGDSVKQASKNDARITPLGAFLRKTSLDELPQFINVLQGSMSVVGPRPHAVAHNEQYRRLIRGYMLRHTVKPGITGWAQINGWRGETETVEKMTMRIKYDLEYVQKWSLFLDLEIIFLTIFKGFVNKNAY